MLLSPNSDVLSQFLAAVITYSHWPSQLLLFLSQTLNVIDPPSAHGSTVLPYLNHSAPAVTLACLAFDGRLSDVGFRYWDVWALDECIRRFRSLQM